jgi:hypothetical protein
MAVYVVVREQTVFHYGELRGLMPLPGRTWLYEGDTLSVSLCPREWYQLAPSRDPRTALYAIERLDRKPATFVDLSRLTKANMREIDAWAVTQGYGTTAAPNLSALTIFHGTQIPAIPLDYGEIAVLIAWAKSQPFDGIWFTDPIAANMPETSRGGIFQQRLSDFEERQAANLDLTGWPTCRKPTIFLE